MRRSLFALSLGSDSCDFLSMRLLVYFTLVAFVALLGGCGSPGPSAGGLAGVTVDLIPAGKHGRHKIRPMRPTYITVHGTDNRGSGANARAHSNLLRTGGLKGPHNSLGYVIWHFTVDDHSTYQHLPTNERGEHADYNGPGNRSSIGIEICMNRDGNLDAATDRCARLVAALMNRHGIPISHVVPHYHWDMVRYDDGKRLGHKACPSFLMDNGRPGKKWEAFRARVARYARG